MCHSSAETGRRSSPAVVHVTHVALTICLSTLIAITSAHLAPPPSAAATPTVAAARTLKSDYVRRLVFLTPPNEIATDDGDSDADADAAAAENFLDWYQAGVESYLANDWTSCAEYIDRALAGYRDFYAATASCRLKCRHVAAAVAPLVDADVDDLPYYESIVRRTLCLVKCKQMLLPQFDEFFAMNAWSQEVFRSRKPYTYLQLCHYRLGNVLGSAQATYTALLRNPHDAMMKTNLHFYLGKLAPEQRIEDLEQWRFASAYLAALRAYAAEDYATVVARMEESLALFRAEYDECRAFCEGDYAQGWQPDFVTSTANHFTYVLRCKQNCTDDLAYIRGQEYEHVFASHYEYLHISYYRVNETLKACRAAASFLHLQPDSSEMQANLAFYQKGKLAACRPRPESEQYAAQQRYEDRLLDFITREFADDRVQVPARKLQAIQSDTAAIDRILRQS